MIDLSSLHDTHTMGGSTSKRSLLQKHGQLLTEEEREAIFSCFIAITSDQDAEGFSLDQLTVSFKGLYRKNICVIKSCFYSHIYRQSVLLHQVN